MKVLRTALFSTFLMICLMNVGYSQVIHDPTGQIDPSSATPRENSDNPSEIEIDVLEAIAVPDTRFVIVQYNVATSPNSIATINEEGNPTILISQSVSGSSIMTAIFEMGTSYDDNLGRHLECEVCDNASNCEMVGCVVVTTGQNTGGGGN